MANRIFFDFDGATDRLPVEMMFGLALAWITMKLARKIYQRRMERSEKISLIWDRNHKIRHGSPPSHPCLTLAPAAGDPGDSRRGGPHRVGA